MAAVIRKQNNPMLPIAGLLLLVIVNITANHHSHTFMNSHMNLCGITANFIRVSFTDCPIAYSGLTENRTISRQRNITSRKHKTLLLLLILLANDIQQNPGPANASIFPCGVCEVPVTWYQVGVCCNNCSIWYHKTCGDISSRNMSYLEKSHVVWHCCKCNSINIDSFTFNSFELHTTNMFTPLTRFSGAESTFESFTSSAPFSPLHTSSPKKRTKQPSMSSRDNPSINNSIKSVNDTSRESEKEILPRHTNLRLLTVNCCSVNTNKAEFKATVDDVKPDLICGTESWLKGVKPSSDPGKNCIKNCEVFPDSHIYHRNDRDTLGGGVFTGIRSSLVSDEKTELVTECEIVWSKIKLKSMRDLTPFSQ